MPSKSKSQQRLMNLVLAYKEGKLNKDDFDESLWNKIKEIAKDMKKSDVKDFTKLKVEEQIRKLVREELLKEYSSILIKRMEGLADAQSLKTLKKVLPILIKSFEEEDFETDEIFEFMKYQTDYYIK